MSQLSSAQAISQAIVFIDAAVADSETLASRLVPGVELVILDPTQDGVEQITATLQGRSGIDSVQIISHGAAASLQLGATRLDSSNLSSYQNYFQQWKTAFSDRADILLYGCNVAAPTSSSPTGGNDFISQLSQLTGADVAASNNLTGKGGDWNLEVQTGTIESSSALQSAAMADYQGTLGVITVTSAADSGRGSLREAIATATAGSTIRFASSLKGKTITLKTGELAITKNLTIDGGAMALTISGNNASRVLNINKQLTVTLSNLTIANGKTTGAGGGVNVRDYSKITVNNCKFNNNSGGIGGGMRIGYGGSGSVTNSSFTGNNGTSIKSGFSGGAIATNGSGSLTVKGSQFTDNRGINGGAIYSLLGPLTVENSQFRNNSAGGDIGGGAIFTDGGNPVGPSATVGGNIIVRGSRFEGNRALGEGGAMVLYGYGPDKILLENSTVIGNTVTPDAKGIARGGGLRGNSEMTIRNVTFANNTATKQGGGIWMDSKRPVNIVNSTFSGNKVLNDAGGAMFLNTGSTPVNIINSTIANNSAGRANGALWMGGASNPITLTNSIVVNNTAKDPSQRQVGYQPRDGGGNIEFPGPTSGRRVAKGSRIVDPRLGSLQTINGTLVHPLLSGSPAINTGVRTGSVPTTDQRGYRRDGQIDVGAFEVGARALSRTVNAVQRTAHDNLTNAQPRSFQTQLTATANSDLLTGVQSTGAMVGTPAARAIAAEVAPTSLPTRPFATEQAGFGLLDGDRSSFHIGSGTQQFAIGANQPLQTLNSTQSFISLPAERPPLSIA